MDREGIERGELSKHLQAGLDASGQTVDRLAERTKVPRSTIRALLGENISAILPERVYLRGHLAVIAREMKLDPEESLALFDAENPPEENKIEAELEPRFGPGTLALAAGCGAIALVAIVLAFVQ